MQTAEATPTAAARAGSTGAGPPFRALIERMPDRSRRASRPPRGTEAFAVTERPCAVCGRRITWRRKWARDWDEVRYCSDACRRQRLGPEDEALEATMLAMLAARGPSASLCPSEPLRRLHPDDWRPRMEAARRAARRLVARGLAEITQGGRVVDPSTARGPIRVRAARRPG